MKWFAYLCAGLGLLTGANSVAAKDLSGLEECARIHSNTERLACFDALAADMLQSKPARQTVKQTSDEAKEKAQQDKRRANAPAELSRSSQQPAREAASQSQNAVKEFGLENRQKPDKEEVEEVTSTVIGLEKSPRGKLILKLENGMIWQQKNDDYFKAEINDEATVSRGFFGVFYLGVEGTNRRIKVERVD